MIVNSLLENLTLFRFDWDGQRCILIIMTIIAWKSHFISFWLRWTKMYNNYDNHWLKISLYFVFASIEEKILLWYILVFWKAKSMNLFFHTYCQWGYISKINLWFSVSFTSFWELGFHNECTLKRNKVRFSSNDCHNY
jgi:hypothetical protein